MGLLVLLAALLSIGNAQHVNFRRMSSTGTDAGVKADTGYATPVIGYLWRKYRTQLINRVRGYEGFRIVGNAGEKALAEYVGLCLFAAFWYMSGVLGVSFTKKNRSVKTTNSTMLFRVLGVRFFTYFAVGVAC